MWALLLQCGRGIEGLPDKVVRVRWACPLSRVTFEPCQVLLWAWHGVKGEAMAVNEAEHTTCGKYCERKGYEGVRWV